MNEPIAGRQTDLVVDDNRCVGDELSCISIHGISTSIVPDTKPTDVVITF